MRNCFFSRKTRVWLKEHVCVNYFFKNFICTLKNLETNFSIYSISKLKSISKGN